MSRGRRWSWTQLRIGSALPLAVCCLVACSLSHPDAEHVASPAVDTHPKGVLWDQVLPQVPSGWRITFGPREMTLAQVASGFGSPSKAAADLRFAAFERGVDRTISGTPRGETSAIFVNERLYQFGSAGDAAQWFISVADGAQPILGNDITSRTRVRADGGAFVILRRGLYPGGYHVGHAVALEGDMVVTVILYSKPALTVAAVSDQLTRCEQAAGRGITRPVPTALPTSLP